MSTSLASSALESAHRSWAAIAVTCVLFAIVCLSWGTTWLGIKIAVETVPPLTAAGLRFLIAFPLFLALTLVCREPLYFPKGKRGFFAFVTLGYFTIPYYLLNHGEMFVSSGLTALLFSAMPVFILIFSAVLLKERIALFQVFGIGIGFFALYMIIVSQGLHLDYAGIFGVAAILAAAIMHGLAYVLTKKDGADISVITYNTLPIGIAGVLLTLTGFIIERPDFSEISVRSWGALVYLGIVASVGGFIVYFVLLKRLRPIVLSFVFIIFPVIAIIIGAWYESHAISRELIIYSGILLACFAITKLPARWLVRNGEAS